MGGGLEKIHIGLVMLLHICGVIPTPQLPIYRQKLCIGCRYHCTKRKCCRIECRYHRIEWWVFVFQVSQCFKSVSWCFTSVSWCFTSGSWYFLHVSCLTMFCESRNDRHRVKVIPCWTLSWMETESNSVLGKQFPKGLILSLIVIPCVYGSPY